MRQAHITPTAASIKLQMLAGADSQLRSFAFTDPTSVCIRSAVVKHIKNPMTKMMARPTFLLSDICKREITGMGNPKITRSVKRLKEAHVQLRIVSENDLKADSDSDSPKPGEIDTVALDCRFLPRLFNRGTLEDGENDECKPGSNDCVNQRKAYASKQCRGKDAEVQKEKCQFVYCDRCSVEDLR